LGFSAEWLALREPADHAARDSGLLRAAVTAAGPNPVIVDVGCGTGSSVRALGPLLPEGTKWHLVDNDQALLNRAGAEAGRGVTLHCQDIQELELLPLEGATLITASALIDIVSRQWLVDFAARVRVPFYCALTYDGVMSWTPKDLRDSSVAAAFNAHQRGDKGFGQALGPDAVGAALEVFANSGFEVAVAKSPWQLGPGDEVLHRELVAGIAGAAWEAGEGDALPWGETRTAAAGSALCVVGHQDILALPGTTVAGSVLAPR
jgi:SAM-dependent methyltransferase